MRHLRLITRPTIDGPHCPVYRGVMRAEDVQATQTRLRQRSETARKRLGARWIGAQPAKRLGCTSA